MPEFVFDAEPYEPPESAAEEGYAETPKSGNLGLQAEEGSGFRYLGGAVNRAQNPGASWKDRALSMALLGLAGARGVNAPQQNIDPGIRESLTPYRDGEDQGAYPAAQKLTADEINTMYAPKGYRITEEPMTASLGALVGKQKTDSLDRQAAIERNSALHSWPTNFAIGMAASLSDPLNLAAGMIPGVGEEMIASQIARVGITGVANRMAARAASGATVWAAGTVPITGMKMALSPQEAVEFGMHDALYEVFMGAAMGALFHSAGGVLRETKIWGPDALMQRDALARAKRLSETNAPIAPEPIPGSAETRQAVPETAFGEERATSLRTAFEGEESTGQPVDLHELGFTKDEVDALHRDGLVDRDGTMSPDQYQAWLDERAVRAPEPAAEELTSKPQESAAKTGELPREEITPRTETQAAEAPPVEPDVPPGQPPLPATPGAHADAMRVAMSQVMDGRPVDVTPIAEIAATQQRPRIRTIDEIMATEKDAKGKPVTKRQAEKIQEQDILAVARPITPEEMEARRAGVQSTPARVADQIRQQDRDGYATGIPDSELHQTIQEVYGPKPVEEEAPKPQVKAEETVEEKPVQAEGEITQGEPPEPRVTIETAAEEVGVDPAGKTPEQVADEIVERLPTERAVQEADSQIEAHEASNQEFEREWIVYHGSRALFDQFDTRFIGTGEGAQAFGRGLYFAENHGIGQSYQYQLGGRQYELSYKGRLYQTADNSADLPGYLADTKAENTDLLHSALDYLKRGDTPQEAVARLRSTDPRRAAEIDRLEPIILDTRLEEKPGGHLYTVRIKAKPEEMLDWDKPLNEQSPYVTKALDQIVKSRDRMPAEWIKSSPGAEQRMLEAGIKGIRYADAPSRPRGDVDAEIAHLEALLTENRELLKNPHGALGPEDIADLKKHGADFQERLDKLKNPTRNVVVFDHNDVEITHRNGEPVTPKAMTEAEANEMMADQAKEAEGAPTPAEDTAAGAEGTGGGARPEPAAVVEEPSAADSGPRDSGSAPAGRGGPEATEGGGVETGRGGGAEPAVAGEPAGKPGGTAGGAEPAGPARDSHGNLIHKVGDRVVITEGPLAGRHGEVTEANGLVMQSVFGGQKTEPFYSYRVRTDGGAEAHGSKFEAATGKAPEYVPDPVYNGHTMAPEQLQRSIDYDLSSVQKANGAAARARTQTSKSAHRRAATEAQRAADQKQAVLDAWKDAHPEEATRIFGEPETPDLTPKAEVPTGKMSLVETNHTKTGAPLWVVTSAERVPTETFNEMKRTAKDNGGYYSSFRGNGAVPGWTFKDRAAAEAFMRTHGAETPVATPRAEPPGEAPTPGEVTQQAGQENPAPVEPPSASAPPPITPAEKTIADAVAPAEGKGPVPVTRPTTRTAEEYPYNRPGYTDPEAIAANRIAVDARNGKITKEEAARQLADMVVTERVPRPFTNVQLATALIDRDGPLWNNALAEAEARHAGRRAVEPPPVIRGAEGEARPSDYGSKNKLVTTEEADAIRARLKAKAKQLRAGIDPEMMLDGAKLAVYHLEAGTRLFADYAREMVADIGDEFRPYLRSWYESARHWPEFDSRGMSKPEEIEAEIARWTKERQPEERAPLTDEDRAEADQILDAHRGDPVMDDIAQQVAEGRAPEDIADTPGVPFSPAEIEGIADALERRGELPEPEEVEGGVQGTVPVRDEGTGAEDVQRTEAVGETERVRPAEVGAGAPTAGGDAGALGEGAGREADNAGGTRGGGNGQGANDRVPATRRNARSRAAGRSARPDADVQGENYVIEPGALEEGRGPKTKARDNVDAIRIVKQLDAEQRLATKAEQDVLARYVGWGGLKRVFDEGADDYRDIRSALKELLTDEEYRTAQRSTQYAHYTAENVIRSMWDAMRRFGFEGGRVFEPGMGIGHFLGLMPRDVAAKSSYRGVEMDHLTARIAQALYPQSGVVQADFTQHALPEKAFDLVIGNPPFSDTVIGADPKYRAHGFMLHDYFFAKSLDAVRPNGLLGFVTSAGTMNKLDDAARRYLAERAEFLGGIRLPSSAFRRNAGTEVTTDILFFKRRPEGVVPLAEGEVPNWAQTVVRSLENKEGQIVEGNVSRYFSEHPEMVLGKETFADKLQASDRYAVHPEAGRDLDADLREALDRLPENVMEPEPTPEQRAMLDFSSTEKKDGSFYVSDDGKLMQYRDGAGREVPRRGKGQTGGFTAADIERIQHLVPMRDALRDVFSADLARDDARGAEARARLNEQYNAFVEKFGPVNKAEFQYRRPTLIQQETARLEAREEARFVGDPWDDGDFDPSDMLAQRKSISEIAKAREAARQKAVRDGRKFKEGTFDPEDLPDEVYERRPNIKPFMSDPESYRLRSIESYNDASGQASKKRIFFESILKHEEEPPIHTADDGVLWSMNKFGRFDLSKIAEKTGRDQSSLVAELGDKVFKVPGTEDVYQTRDEYLSGDVVSKLDEARAAAETDPDIRRNIPALEAAQPPPLAPSQITMTLGMPWIPINLVKQFLRDHLELGDPAVFHSEITGTWHVNGERWGHMPGVPKWGTDRRDVFELLSDAMNRTPPRIYDVHREPGGGTTRTFNATATQAAQDAVEKIKNEFQDWARKDTQRAEDLAGLYNGRYNRTVLRQYDGSFLTTPGVAADWGWRPHQTRVISRVIQNGTTYMAHAVGAGKTSAMIGSGMEMRRLGLVKKPMYVVPNHMLGQFTKEFYEQYPTARIAVADEERFHTHNRRQFVANVAQDDLDAVIITHSGFKKIPVGDEYMGRMIQDQIDELEQAISELRDQGAERYTVSRIENQKEKLEQKLRGMASADKDQTLTFEQMGVDFMFVDEAHLFRKLQFVTKQSGLKGISPEGSDMSFDLFAKVRYLDQQNPGRAAVFASGTPVTNTMGELYSVQRFMQPKTLEKNGLSHFDSWSQAFGDTKTSLEETAAGTYQPVTRFGQFVNIPELYKMVGEVMDIVTPTELEQYVVRPKLAGGQRQFHLAPRTPVLDAYQAELGQRMEAIKTRKGPPAKGDDILLSVINDGRHSAIDPRFVAETQSDPRSKLNIMLQNVARIHRETEDHQFYDPKDGHQTELMRGPATQMIFANLGVNGRGPMGFSTYQWIKEALRREGIAPEQIAFIGDYKTAIQRQALFNDMNEGKIRILVGSTQKMGTGVNAQRRLVALHNLDPLWYPADDEQRVGRILRQGNLNREIQVHDYSTKGTYDSAMWKMMGNKARFIEQFFRGDPELRNMEDLGEASMYEQASAMSTTDERIITLTELKQDLDKARRREDAHDMQQASLRTSIKNHEYNVDFYKRSAERIRKDIERREDTRGDAFSMLVVGEKFDKRTEASEALDVAIKDRGAGLGRNAETPMGRIGGFPLIMRRDSMDAIRFALRTDDGEIPVQGLTGKGVIASAESALRAFEDRLAGAENSVARNLEAIENIKPLIGQPFTGGGEIIRLAKAVSDLEAEIKNKPVVNEAPEGAGGAAADGAQEGTRPTGEAPVAPERGQRPGEQAKPDPEIQAAERELQEVQKNLSPEDREELARAIQAQREAEERAAGIDEAGRCLGGRA
jgi:N12 class adenine-specific DNA methylase/tRNA1(Val) A37 N6-methylase TrmN6